MKAGNHNVFHRVAKPIKGASEAMAPRSHATEAVSETGGEKRPTRRDMFRRQMLQSRKDKQP
jgi:hypothetical protein